MDIQMNKHYVWLTQWNEVGLQQFKDRVYKPSINPLVWSVLYMCMCVSNKAWTGRIYMYIQG